MTDEIDNLKRRIKELEIEIAQKKVGDDPRRQALYGAGVPLDRLDDAAAVFRPSGNAGTGVFTLGELTGPIESLAREWLSTRPWFGAPEPEAKPGSLHTAFRIGDHPRPADFFGGAAQVACARARVFVISIHRIGSPVPAVSEPDFKSGQFSSWSLFSFGIALPRITYP